MGELLKHRERVKMEMEIYAVQEAKGAQTRARAKFIEEGEKNTRYFLNLEKAQSNVKIMDRIKKGDGQVTTNQQEIIKEQVRFDSDRYRKTVDFQEPSAQAFSDGTDVPQLSDEQKTSIEGARAHTHSHTQEKRYQLFGNTWRKRFIVSLRLN